MGAVAEANAERMLMFMRNLENRMKEMELTLAHLAEMLMAIGVDEKLCTMEPETDKITKIDPTENPLDAFVEDC